MFGKTREPSDVDERTGLDVTIDDFFGDESAVAEAVRVDHLHQRVTQVEQQISSQFTSLAAYAQIAQEQVELVRSEAQNGSERSEQRVVGLIERERADRMDAGAGAGTGVSARLDALDAQVAEIRDSLQQCLSNQKALADAITDLFAPVTEASSPMEAPLNAAKPDDMMPTAMPAPLTVVPSTPAQTDIPPPPVAQYTLEDLDADLGDLGVNIDAGFDQDFTDDVDEDHDDDLDAVVVSVFEAAATSNGSFDGPIDGLSLA